ncbi:MAG: TonB-dependent hemoglobin/transferrin/lactoferrin family receptor [Alphaproteobacteria bacterium]|nr:TonB-dependent hemoglobin/transferrin/lactoferrin family receptor [Alphaproteobacteria bacterium]
MRRTRFLLLAGVSLLAVNASESQAQTVMRPITLDPITVTTTKTAQPVDEVPANVDVITKEQIDLRNPAKLDDLLRELPGVDMQGGPRRVSQDVNIRGFGGQRVVTTLDGARQNFDAGHKGRFFLDPDLLREVEVVRGSNSALHGSGAIGGVVSMETKDASDFLAGGETFGFRAKYGFSTVNNEPYYSAGAFARVGDKVDVVGNFSFRDSGTLKQGGGRELANSAEELTDVFLKTQIRPLENYRLSFTYIDFNEEGRQPNNADSQPNTTDNPIVDRKTKNNTLALNYSFSAPNSDLINPTFKLYRNTLDVDENRVVPATPARLDTTHLETWGFDLYNTTYLDFAGMRHALTYGAEHFNNEQEGFRNGAVRQPYPSAEGKVTGYYLQDEIDITKTFTLTLGIRYDTYGGSASSVSSRSIDESKVSPRLGANWRALPWLDVYGSYGYGFRAPALTELYVAGSHLGPQNLFIPNPNLRPEKTKNAEAGARLKFDNVWQAQDSVRVKAGVFHTKAEDFIDTVVTITNPATLAGSTTNVNIPKAEVTGFEAELRYDMSRAFAQVGYARIRGENETTGRPLDSIPADKLTTVFGGRVPDYNLVFGLRSEFVAEQDRVSGTPFVPGTATATPATSGYAIHGVFLSWSPSPDWAKGLRVDAGVDNIFDKTYRRHFASLYEEGRDFRFAVTYTKGF